MANYETLKTAIQSVVKTNGNNEITGALLQQALLSMISSLGAYFQFLGVAKIETNPGTPDQNVAYIAGPGTYPNFDSFVVPQDHIGFFAYNGTWNNQAFKISTLREDIVGVQNIISENAGQIAYYKNLGTTTGWNGTGTYSKQLTTAQEINNIVFPPFCSESAGGINVKYYLAYGNPVGGILTPTNLTFLKQGVISNVGTTLIENFSVKLNSPVTIPQNNRVYLFMYAESGRIRMLGGGNDVTENQHYNSYDALGWFLAIGDQYDSPFNQTWHKASIQGTTAIYLVCNLTLEYVVDGLLTQIENQIIGIENTVSAQSDLISTLRQDVDDNTEDIADLTKNIDETVSENAGQIAYYKNLGTTTGWNGIGIYSLDLSTATKFNQIKFPPFCSESAGGINVKYYLAYGNPVGGILTPTNLTFLKQGIIPNVTNNLIENFVVDLDSDITLHGVKVFLFLYAESGRVRVLGGGNDVTTNQKFNSSDVLSYLLASGGQYDSPFNQNWSKASIQTTARYYSCNLILRFVDKGVIPELQEQIGAIPQQIQEQVEEKIINAQNVEIYLPNRFYAVVGDTLQLFYQAIVGVVDLSEYDIFVVCAKGKTYPRYFEYRPTSSDIGTTTFTLYVKDRNNNILGQGSCDIITVASPTSPVSLKQFFAFGDSLTNDGKWTGEAKRRLVGTSTFDSITGKGLTNIAFYGYKENNVNGQLVNFFGVGGWVWANYLVKAKGGAFRFYVENVSSLSIGAVYSNNGYNYTIQEINVTGTSGNIRCTTSANTNVPTTSGTLTKVSGDGDNSISFTTFETENQNPLWDDANNKMSFIPYVQNCGATTIDAVFVLLTWNGQEQWKAYNGNENVGHIGNAKTFARTLHTEYPSAKLFIMGLQMPSFTGGLGNNYGATGGYIDAQGLKQCALNYNKALQDMCNLDEFSGYCEFVPIAPQFDSLYNMPLENKNVNVRNGNKTEMIGTNGVHPADSGYNQIGDAVYRVIVANYCQ